MPSKSGREGAFSAVFRAFPRPAGRMPRRQSDAACRVCARFRASAPDGRRLPRLRPRVRRPLRPLRLGSARALAARTLARAAEAARLALRFDADGVRVRAVGGCDCVSHCRFLLGLTFFPFFPRGRAYLCFRAPGQCMRGYWEEREERGENVYIPTQNRPKLSSQLSSHTSQNSRRFRGSVNFLPKIPMGRKPLTSQRGGRISASFRRWSGTPS